MREGRATHDRMDAGGRAAPGAAAEEQLPTSAGMREGRATQEQLPSQNLAKKLVDSAY